MRIAVALSGGMDSLLALALLREAGCEVLALHAHFLPPDERQLRLADALAGLCQGFGVAFHAVDLSPDFRRLVIEPFKAAYATGLTPNPCAGCNRDMKFGLLFDAASGLGADRIATGHYARLMNGPGGFRPDCEVPSAGSLPSQADPPAVDRSGNRNGEPHVPPVTGLYRGVDPAKDQSYFLTLTPWDSLTRAVFPLGGWLKADVPAALAVRGLAPPLPSESQEVCFIPGDDYRAFLEAEGIALTGEGPVLLEDGREIGRHQGLWRHTIGQRKGLGIPFGHPLYVVDKIASRNALVVGPKSALDARECLVREVNVLADPGEWPEVVLAQTCYRQRPVPARADFLNPGLASGPMAARSAPEEGQRALAPGLTLRFEKSVPRPTPGQVAALFDGAGRALAGGIIA